MSRPIVASLVVFAGWFFVESSHAQAPDGLERSTLWNADRNSDGTIDDADVVAAVYGALRRATPSDLDMDGSVNGLDTIAAIERILRRSIGDVDGSGKATLDDVMSVASSPESDESDVNVDGDSDLLDLAAVLGLLSTQEPPTLNRVAQSVYRNLGRHRPQAFDMIDDGSEFGGGGWPIAGAHTIGVSSSYPSDHGVALSAWFPNNHRHTVTSGWPTLPPNHNGTISQGSHFINFSHHQWPANHSYSWSSDWGTDPNSHSQATSESWENQPNHITSQSTTWPSGHGADVSRTYPPNHSGANSATRSPEPHMQQVSGTWHDVSTSSNAHGTAFSAQWPTNHSPDISTTWPGSHQGTQSAAWPTNHQELLSASWPAGYPNWPPNHVGQDSSSWSNPTPSGWPIFPADHSWWTTVLEARDLVNP